MYRGAILPGHDTRWFDDLTIDEIGELFPRECRQLVT